MDDKKCKDSRCTAQRAMDMIDSTYKAKGYKIIPKDQNAYVMPFTMKASDDVIDPSKFY